MEKLPVEIVLEILGLLEQIHLTKVNILNKWFYSHATPELYSTVSFLVNPYTLDLTYKSSKLLEKLLVDERLCSFVRAITVEFMQQVWESRLRRTNTSLLIIGALLLKNPHIRSNLRSFRWRLNGETEDPPIRIPLDAPATLTSLVLEASQAPLSTTFPLLREFECRDIVLPEHADWVKLQFVHARSLQSARLSARTDDLSIPITNLIPEKAQAPSIKRLKLEKIDIDRWPGPSLEMVENVSFRYCRRVSNALLLSPRAKKSLKKFELISSEDHPYLGAFFSNLAGFTSLSHVTLLISPAGSSIPIAWFRPHRLSLQSLVVECRHNPRSYLSVYHYSVRDVVSILNSFPRLQHLGLPVQFNGAGKELYKYLRDFLKEQPRLREFHARTYVLPGLTSLPRVRSNARSFAKAIIETHNKDFTFFYGNQIPDLHVWKLTKEAGKDRRTLPRLDSIGAYDWEVTDYEWVHKPRVFLKAHSEDCEVHQLLSLFLFVSKKLLWIV